MILLNCNQLAEEIDRHPTYVYAMKRAGYKFSHGNRTMLMHALDWLQANPEFRSTRYRGKTNTEKRPVHLPAVTAGMSGELIHSNG